MLNTGITAISYEVPVADLSHEELRQRFGSDAMDRLLAGTGIQNRKVVTGDEIASDLAYRACTKLLEEANIDRASINLLIVATQMPDYLLPTTACILQNKLGLEKNCAAFDINLGCSQFVYAHSVAHAMISAGVSKRALVVTCDTPSRIVNPKDNTVVPLFGDAATCCLVESVEDEAGYLDFELGTDGSESSALIWPASGLREGSKSSRNTVASSELCDEDVRTADDLFMDGQRIFLFTLQTVPKYLKILLDRNELVPSDIGFFALHQASAMIVNSIAKKLSLQARQYNSIYRELGNSGGSTVGISLAEALRSKSIKPNDLIVMSAFGVGLSWGNILYKVPANLPKVVI